VLASKSPGLAVSDVCAEVLPPVWLMPKAMQEKKNIGAIGRQGVVVLPPVWLMSKATPEERRRR
jgi:hypothetical protein